jgi:hypothetical protein
MVDLNWDGPDGDRENNEIAPPGFHIAEVTWVKPSVTGKGDEMWRVMLSVQDGPHKGAIIFDGIVFSEAAKSRWRMILRALGLAGSVSLSPDDIKKRLVRVEVVDDPKATDPRYPYKVAFKGWSPIDAPTPEQSVPAAQPSGGNLKF